MNSPLKANILLSDEQRQALEQIARAGNSPARAARCARVLLHADSAHPEGCRSDQWISEALDLHLNTVARIRKSFVAGGIDAALGRKVRLTPPVPPKIDGRIAAHLIAICSSKAPEGRARWTLKLLVNELKSRRLVTEVCIETVRRALKKTGCNPGGSNPGAFRSGTRRGSSLKWNKFLTSTPPISPRINR